MSGLHRVMISAVFVLMALLSMLTTIATQAAVPVPTQDDAQPTITPSLTVGIPSLTLLQSVERMTALPGQRIGLSINVSSTRGGAVTLLSQIQGPAQVVSASTTHGKCSGTSCSLNLVAAQIASVSMVLQIDASASSTSVIVQSLAQDQWEYTAASDPNQITILVPPAVNLATPTPTSTSQQGAAPPGAQPKPKDSSQSDASDDSDETAEPEPTPIPATPTPVTQRGSGSSVDASDSDVSEEQDASEAQGDTDQPADSAPRRQR